MSMGASHEITCPHCQHQQEMHIWESINVTVDPHLCYEFYADNINTLRCQGCGSRTRVDVPLLFHDMEAKFCVQYVSEDHYRSEAFFSSLKKDASLAMPDLAASMLKKTNGDYILRPHHVFSMEEMIRYVAFRDMLRDLGRPV